MVAARMKFSSASRASHAIDGIATGATACQSGSRWGNALLAWERELSVILADQKVVRFDVQQRGIM